MKVSLGGLGVAEGALISIFVVASALILGLAIWAIVHARRRNDAIRHQAALLDLAYEPKSTEKLSTLHKNLQPFSTSRGGSPRALNVCRGRRRGIEVRVMDYVYTVSTGKSSHDVWHGVALAYLPEAWPELRIVPEHLGHKIADAFGADDIDFESAEFSRKFWVQSGDRKFAYDVIHPRMMEFLMEPGWSRWHMEGNVICLWHLGRMKPHDVPYALDRLFVFLALVPDHARPARRGTAVASIP